MIFNVQWHIMDVTRFPCNFTGIHYYFQFELNIVYIFDNFELMFHQRIHFSGEMKILRYILIGKVYDLWYNRKIEKIYKSCAYLIIATHWSFGIWIYTRIIFLILSLFFLPLPWNVVTVVHEFLCFMNVLLYIQWNIYFTSVVYLWLLIDWLTVVLRLTRQFFSHCITIAISGEVL